MTIVAGGVTGSFTTFSGWMLDTQPARRGGPRPDRLAQLGLSTVVGFAAVVLGHWLGAPL